MSHLDSVVTLMLTTIWASVFALNSLVKLILKRQSSLVHAVSTPTKFLLWALALFASSLVLRHYFWQELDLGLLQTTFKAVVIVLLHWAAQRGIRQVEDEMLSRPSIPSAIDQTTVIALARLAKIITAMLGSIIFMYTINIDVRALLALGSAGTIVVGIAARDMLANFFGGFMLFVDRPFSVGDKIKADEKNLEGIVQHIGWRRTQILTLEQKPLYIPNSLFLSMGIENSSRAQHQNINSVIKLKGLTTQQIMQLMLVIEASLRQHADIAQDMPLAVNLKHFDSQWFYVQIYCFTLGSHTPRHLKIQQDVLLKVAELVEQIR